MCIIYIRQNSTNDCLTYVGHQTMCLCDLCVYVIYVFMWDTKLCVYVIYWTEIEVSLYYKYTCKCTYCNYACLPYNICNITVLIKSPLSFLNTNKRCCGSKANKYCYRLSAKDFGQFIVMKLIDVHLRAFLMIFNFPYKRFTDFNSNFELAWSRPLATCIMCITCNYMH